MDSDYALRQFVKEHLGSVWRLELLLLLRRNPERCWTADELVKEMRASRMLVADNLLRLQAAGLALLDDRGCYRFAPANPALETLCDAVEEAYRSRPVAVINMIAGTSDPVQRLADAFKFRTDK